MCNYRSEGLYQVHHWSYYVSVNIHDPFTEKITLRRYIISTERIQVYETD